MKFDVKVGVNAEFCKIAAEEVITDRASRRGEGLERYRDRSYGTGCMESCLEEDRDNILSDGRWIEGGFSRASPHERSCR